MHKPGLMGLLDFINNPIHINPQPANPQRLLRPLAKKRFETTVANGTISRQFPVLCLIAQQLAKLRGSVQILMHQSMTLGAVQTCKHIAHGSATQTSFHSEMQPTFNPRLKHARNIKTQPFRTGTKTVEKDRSGRCIVGIGSGSIDAQH